MLGFGICALEVIVTQEQAWDDTSNVEMGSPVMRARQDWSLDEAGPGTWEVRMDVGDFQGLRELLRAGKSHCYSRSRTKVNRKNKGSDHRWKLERTSHPQQWLKTNWSQDSVSTVSWRFSSGWPPRGRWQKTPSFTWGRIRPNDCQDPSPVWCYSSMMSYLWASFEFFRKMCHQILKYWCKDIRVWVYFHLLFMRFSNHPFKSIHFL